MLILYFAFGFDKELCSQSTLILIKSFALNQTCRDYASALIAACAAASLAIGTRKGEQDT